LNKTPDGNYFWITLNNLTPKVEYAFQYLVDDSIRIADPYADKILDPDNDKWISNTTYPNLKPYPVGKTSQIVSVFQTSQDQYVWQVPNFVAPPQNKLNIYELLIRDFSSTSDINGLLPKIDYLKSLGINAIELMPINEFEGNDSWGYNPNFYFAPDKAYGTKEAYKKLIDECHKSGLAVIIDMVLNHVKNSSPLVRMYADANGNPTSDSPWFNVVAPLTCFGAPSWGADFNHELKTTQDLVDRVTKYWLTEFNLDGFRFDFTKGFSNNGSNCGGDYDASRIKILERMYDAIKTVKPGAYAIFEHLVGGQEEVELSNHGIMLWGNMNYSYGQAGMSISQGSDLSGAVYKAHNFTTQNLVTYMESHDEEREAYRIFNYGNNTTPSYPISGSVPTMCSRLALNAAFFFSIPGPKMVWQFGELAYDISIDNNGRVGKKPVKWDYALVPERQQLYNVYSEWLNLRNNFDVFNTDNFVSSLASDTVKTMVLKSASMDAVVVGDFDQKIRYAVPSFTKTGNWYEYFTGETLNVTDVNMKIKLNPGEYRLYTSSKLQKIQTTPPVASSVSISGKNTVGSILTGSYTYTDLSGDLEGGSLLRWFVTFEQDGTRPTYRATTGSTYTITQADLGQFIFYEVTPVAQTGGMLIGAPVFTSIKSPVILRLADAEIAKIKVYPNPVVDQLNISLSNQVTQVILIDASGKQLLTRENLGDTQMKIDFSGYASGAYYLLLNSKDGLIKTEKIIK
jgi:hypothetical protein